MKALNILIIVLLFTCNTNNSQETGNDQCTEKNTLNISGQISSCIKSTPFKVGITSLTSVFSSWLLFKIILDLKEIKDINNKKKSKPAYNENDIHQKLDEIRLNYENRRKDKLKQDIFLKLGVIAIIIAGCTYLNSI